MRTELKDIVTDAVMEFVKLNSGSDQRVVSKIEVITAALKEKYKYQAMPADEYILCASIHFDDGKEYPGQPDNITSGIVLSGWRHGCIFPQIGGLVKERHDLGIYEKEQGFITNLNRFVDREEAAKIALSAGQIKEPIKRLHSEDLY